MRTPWGLLGPALLLDLADGRLVAELRGERAAARGGGRFVLGLEGSPAGRARSYGGRPSARRWSTTDARQCPAPCMLAMRGA
ncbi:hypothetical protein ACPCTN_02380 [Streptomyces cinereoruber]|uniref:hypothetical protein n=1 Tax=Streptomyces cinereoruber TaxID=67260 RepID=UPI003C2CD07F